MSSKTITRLLVLWVIVAIFLFVPRSAAQENYPEASFTYTPSAPSVDELVTFDASSSKPNVGTILKYIWDFGDATGVSESDPFTSHTYTKAGTYNVMLIVIDSEGLTDITTQSITVSPAANSPTASFTYSPAQPLQGTMVSFDASNSTDPDGTIVSYRWNFDDGTPLVEEPDPTTTHAFTTAGTYNVTLTVTDNDGLFDSIPETIKIFSPGAPRARFSNEPENPAITQLVTFNASLSEPNGGVIISYFWDFDDQTNGTGMIVTHRYASFGYYRVNLTVMDSEGYSDYTSITLKVNIRDVAIIGVTPSANEVYSGQTVNITVVVRNQGTTNETFNVTIYYQDKALETQVVNDLAPSAQRILTFSWNTTDMAPDFNYTIKAEANILSWETYTVDNTYIDGTVKISATSQPFDWRFLFYYAIPISLGLTSFLITGILWKRQKTSLRAVGFEYFNDLTYGGIPEASSVMIMGEAASGKSILCQELVRTYLTKKKACIYVTYDSFTDEVRKNMQSFHWDVSTHEKNGTFTLIDSYSPIAGQKSQEKHRVEQPFVLSDLGIAISTAFRDVRDKSPRVFIDSTTPLFMRLNALKVMEFLQDRGAKVKMANGILFFTVGEGTVPPDIIGRLEELVDCIIELKIFKEKEKVLHKLCLRKMRGREFAQVWVPISIEPEKGLTFLIPKASAKNKKPEKGHLH